MDYIINQELTSFFCKDLNSNYFQLCEPYSPVSIPNIQLYYCSAKVTINITQINGDVCVPIKLLARMSGKQF